LFKTVRPNGGIIISKLPLIATVIPTFHEENFIETCLNSLCDQTYPSSLHQIIIVDGNSSDKTVDIINAFISNQREDMPQITLLKNPNRYVSQARNIAFEYLPENVEYIFETVAHATFPNDHLEIRMQEFLNLQKNTEEKIAAIGTILKPPEENMPFMANLIEATLANPLGSGRGAYAQFKGLKRTRIPPLAIYRVDALKSVDGYDDSLITAQDSDINMRLLKKGWQLWRSDISCIHVTKRQTFLQWLRFGHRNGFWRVKLVRKHPTRLPLGEVAPWFGLLLTMSLFCSGVQLWWFPPALYIFVIFSAGFIETIRWRTPLMFFGVPILLFMLHTTFSIGFLHGFFVKGKAPKDRVVL
jgi:succinoglycan biosynthesis protein ExoA